MTDGLTGIEAAKVVAEYIRMRGALDDEGDAANIIHILRQAGVRFAPPTRDGAEGAGAIVPPVCCYCDADLSCAKCGMEQPADYLAPSKPAPDAMRPSERQLALSWLKRLQRAEGADKLTDGECEQLECAIAFLLAPVPPAGAPDAMREALAHWIELIEPVRLTADSGSFANKCIIPATVADRDLIVAALRSPAPVPSPDGTIAQDFWHELVEKTDRTSPEECPEMVLITFEELRDFIGRALSPSPAVAAEPVAWPPYIELPLTFWYKNHRGEESLRTAFPISIRFGTTEWHPEAQWLLKAFDRDKQAEREFAMRDMLATPPGSRDREAIASTRYANGKYDLREVLRAGFREMRFVHPDIAADEMIDAILSLPVQPGAGEWEIVVPRDVYVDLLKAVTDEVNEKGAGGYLLARLSDARKYV